MVLLNWFIVQLAVFVFLTSGWSEAFLTAPLPGKKKKKNQFLTLR